MVIGITGGPGTGKTTLAKETASILGGTVLHTDDYVRVGWEQIPYAIIEAVAADRSITVVEGVQVARACRKGLELDYILCLMRPYLFQSDGQRRMAKGLNKIVAEVALLYPGRVFQFSYEEALEFILRYVVREE